MKILKTLSFSLNVIAIFGLCFLFYKRGFEGTYKTFSALISGKVAAADFYYDEKTSGFEVYPDQSNEYIFVGDSLTDFCEWQELFPNKNVKNRGIGKDKIEGVIKRLHSIVRSKPKKIFLLIGINNVTSLERSSNIIKKYDKLLALIKQSTPSTTVYVQSILPTNTRTIDNSELITINEALKSLAVKYHYTYVDLYSSFIDITGKIDSKYSFDGIHLNGAGYLVWKNKISAFM